MLGRYHGGGTQREGTQIPERTSAENSNPQTARKDAWVGLIAGTAGHMETITCGARMWSRRRLYTSTTCCAVEVADEEPYRAWPISGILMDDGSGGMHLEKTVRTNRSWWWDVKEDLD